MHRAWPPLSRRAGSRAWLQGRRSLSTTSAADIPGRKITLIGTGANAALIVGKLGAGVAGNSAALVADAGHSLSDLLSDVVTLVTLKISAAPPDAEHPYGHGKFESLGSLGVGALLAATGVGIGAHTVELLQAGVREQPEVTALAAAAAVVSIVSKELLFRKTLEVGKEINSVSDDAGRAEAGARAGAGARAAARADAL